VKELVELLARGLVREEEAVSVTEIAAEDGATTIELRVAPDDLGRIIGRQGRTARALRTLVSAAASRKGVACSLAIIE